MTKTNDARTGARLLKAVSDLMLTLTAKELVSLAADLERRAKAGKAASTATPDDRPLRKALVEDALRDLETADSRETAWKILDALKPTRRELSDMAGRHSVYVAKEDTVARLAEKVIAATVGSRLSSIAIRGQAFDVTPPKPDPASR